MNKTLKASDEVKKLARMFQALGEVVEVLDRIGSVEQAEGEALARVEKLNANAAKIAQGQAEAETEAKLVLESAKHEADSIRAAAEHYHNDATEHANKIKQAATDAEAESQARATAITQAAEAAVQVCAVEVEAKAQELAELEEKIEKARARVAKLLEA